MKKNKLIIEYLEIKKLKHPSYNPRQISDEEFKHLKKSVEKFDAVEPAIINTYKGRVNIIIGGNQRIEVAKKLKKKTFPCVKVSLKPTDEKELNIRLNKNTGNWDWDLLGKFKIPDLINFGFKDWEFTNINLQDINQSDENSEWVGMPEFEKKEGSLKVIVHFQSEKDRTKFLKKYPLKFVKKTKQVWSTVFPFKGRDDLASLKFKDKK